MKRFLMCAVIGTCAIGLAAHWHSPATFAQRRAAKKDAPLRARKAPVKQSFQRVSLEVLIVEIRGAAKDGEILKPSDPPEVIKSRVRELEAKGQINVIDRFQLTTVEDHLATVQHGRTAAVASGRTFAGRGGPVRKNYNQQSLGTIVSAIAVVQGDGLVVELTVEKSELERRDNPADPDGDIVPLATETLQCQTTLKIPNGKTVLAGGIQTKGNAKSLQKYVLVTARIVK